MSRNVTLIYTRVSVLAEKDRARAISPEMQLERCKELPALRGLCVEHFEDLTCPARTRSVPAIRRCSNASHEAMSPSWRPTQGRGFLLAGLPTG